jgi:hypothetical protein
MGLGHDAWHYREGDCRQSTRGPRSVTQSWFGQGSFCIESWHAVHFRHLIVRESETGDAHSFQEILIRLVCPRREIALSPC